MKLDNYLVLVVLVLSFSSLVSAEVCGRDQSCYEQLGTGYFCDESNQTVDGNPQCSLNYITNICNQSAVCTSSIDCNGIGSPLYGNRGCGYGGLCVADPSVYGGKCVQDQDCMSDTQAGTTSICAVGTCTYSPTGGVVKCDDSSDCEADQFCYGTFGVCVNKRSEGGFCSNDASCADDLYCGDGSICIGCEDIVDDPTCISQGAYCELNHSASCQIGSHDYGAVAPVCVSLKEEGDSCWDDGCCATSNCENGVCVGAFSGGDSDSLSALFCNNLSYSLSTYYFDGVEISGASEFDSVNLTNVNILLNYTDLNTLRIPNTISDKFMYSRKEDGGAGYMVGLFYSNSTGDMCYIHQKDTELYTNCFESCLSADLATNETADGSVRLDNDFTTYPLFSCSDSDMAIQSFQRNSPLFQYDFIAFTNFDSTGVDIDSAMAMEYSGLQPSPMGLQYKQISSGLWVGGSYIMDPPANNPTWAFNDEPATAVFHFDFSNPANGIRGFGHEGATSWNGAGILTYLSNADYENVFCCGTNTDCVNEMGDGFCCDLELSTCYFCGLGSATEITITALTDIIAPDESLTLYSTLTDTAGNPIYNEEIEWTLLSGLGSINAQCTTNYEGICQVIYSAPSEDTNVSVQAEFTGSSTYSGTKTAYSITVSDLSNSLFILVIDSASQQPLGNTKITDVNGVLDPAIKYTMPFAGLVGWTGLNNTVEYYVVQVEREGYTPVLATVFPAPAPNIIPLTKTPESGATSEPLPNWGFNTTVPENVGDVTAGFSELLRNFFAVPFLWVLIIILFFLGLAIVKGVIDYVTT